MPDYAGPLSTARTSRQVDEAPLAAPTRPVSRRLSGRKPSAASSPPKASSLTLAPTSPGTPRRLPRTSSLLPPPRLATIISTTTLPNAPPPAPRDISRNHPYAAAPSDSAAPPSHPGAPETLRGPGRRVPSAPRSLCQPTSPIRGPGSDSDAGAREALLDSARHLSSDADVLAGDAGGIDTAHPTDSESDEEPAFTPLPPLELLPALDHSISEPLSSLLQTSAVRPPVPADPAPAIPAPAAPAKPAVAPPAKQRVDAKMPHDPSRESRTSSRHSRRRSSKSSANDTDRSRTSKPPSQKAMLSRALQKANTAVQLDNAQNLEGARHAYSEACELLQQVLKRTSADEDKKKLEAIRQTYASRIEELDQMEPWQGREYTTKALPARPGSDEYQPDSPDFAPQAGGWAQSGYDGVDSFRQHQSSRSYGSHDESSEAAPSRRRRPSQGQSNLHSALQSSFSRADPRKRPSEAEARSQPAMPQPLNTHRSPQLPQASLPLRRSEALSYTQSQSSRSSEPRDRPGHFRDHSQNSWLDAVGESGGSTSPSVHSRTSSQGYRRKHIRGTSGNTEAEFDTALDAAIEAAYDDGYEPMAVDDFGRRESGEDAVAKALRRVEMARERVRQTERETYGYAKGLEPRQQPPGMATGRLKYGSRDAQDGFYDDGSSDEEERMLEEMARDYDIADFTMSGQQHPQPTTENRPPAPYTARQKRSEAAGPTPAASQVEPIRPLAEKVSLSNINLGPSLPPPKQSLPDLPPQRGVSPMQQSVRSRRLSGQNPKQLKIETTKLGPPKLPVQIAEQPRSATLATHERPATAHERPATATERPRNALHARSTPSIDVTHADVAPTSSPGRFRSPVTDEGHGGRGMSPPPPNKLRKNFSSSSLRSMKSRNMSLTNIEDGSDMSPGTPSSNPFGSMKTPALPTAPTPLSSEFRENMDSVSTGVHLFDDHFHQPASPGSPDPLTQDAPVALEPCPIDFMLRPFWLMRCLFQTLVHPRGGYVSAKLFVPRDVWRVKGVKLRNVEDKIANCDLLTAALLKLAQVDTCDADAVLEEMQSLEGILEQVQTTLSRKLGNEVGVQGSGALFKDASAGGDADGSAVVPRSASVTAKSSFSWRRLRSKSSGVGLGGAYNSKIGGADAAKDGSTGMPSLPMTPQPTSRPARRDLTQAQFVGPNAHYMGSLARLFDAAQAIDQIARQVEDPGLRHADKTQVGLELCTRHAAEFFGFYICRFALTDMGLLLEKFIKRGSEWVIA